MLEKIVVEPQESRNSRRHLEKLCLSLFAPLLFFFGSVRALNEAIAKMPNSITRYGRAFPPPVDLVIIKNNVEEDTSHFILNREKDVIYRLGLEENDTNNISILSFQTNKKANISIPGAGVPRTFIPTVKLHHPDSTELTPNIYNINKGVDRGQVFAFVSINSNKEFCEVEDTTNHDGHKSYFHINNYHKIKPGDSINVIFAVETFENNIRRVFWPSEQGRAIVPSEKVVVSTDDTSITKFGDVIIFGRPNTTIDLTLGRIVPIITDGSISVKMPSQNPTSAEITCFNSLDLSNWFIRNSSINTRIISSGGDTIYRTDLPVDTIFPGENKKYNIQLPLLEKGNYILSVLFNVPTDTLLTNNFSELPFSITRTPPAGWSRLINVPGDKKCKKGSDMCTDAYNRVWITKGGTLENYIFNGKIFVNAVQLPYGSKGKSKEGSCIEYANGKIYYKEGQGPGFWAKDTNASASWVALANYTVDGKYVKGGTDLAWNGNDKIFMLVGGRNKNNRPVVAIYSIPENRWYEELLPEGLIPKKKFDQGASIARVGGGDHFYVSVGRSTELLERTSGGTWRKITSIPITKSSFKGDITYNPVDSCIYVAEGNNTQNFIKYSPHHNRWTSLPSWPIGTGKLPKNCKIEATLNGDIYGLKGNNSNEFWSYAGLGTNSLSNLNDSNQGIKVKKSIITRNIKEMIKNNPDGIYDASGRKIRYIFEAQQPGVYFIKRENDVIKIILPK